MKSVYFLKPAEDISAHPEAWPVIQNNTRRRLVYRFPYALLYRIDPGEIDHIYLVNTAWFIEPRSDSIPFASQ